MPESILDLKRRLFREKYGIPGDSWKKFREYLMVEAIPSHPDSPNHEARSLFDAIQLSFDGSCAGGDLVAVDPYLLHNLAACARVALGYDTGVEIHWNDHDSILNRTFNGFAHTVIRAIQEGRIKEIEGKVHLGGLLIPDYFVVMAKTFELD